MVLLVRAYMLCNLHASISIPSNMKSEILPCVHFFNDRENEFHMHNSFPGVSDSFRVYPFQWLESNHNKVRSKSSTPFNPIKQKKSQQTLCQMFPRTIKQRRRVWTANKPEVETKFICLSFLVGINERGRVKFRSSTPLQKMDAMDGCKENAERTRDARWDELKRRSVNP